MIWPEGSWFELFFGDFPSVESVELRRDTITVRFVGSQEPYVWTPQTDGTGTLWMSLSCIPDLM